MRIITNNVPRDIVHGWELSDAERREFDYHTLSALMEAEFFRYKGQLYDVGEFSRIIPPGSVRCHPTECAAPEFQGWDGYMSDSFFSGLLVRWARDDSGDLDSERIIVALYLA